MHFLHFEHEEEKPYGYDIDHGTSFEGKTSALDKFDQSAKKVISFSKSTSKKNYREKVLKPNYCRVSFSLAMAPQVNRDALLTLLNKKRRKPDGYDADHGTIRRQN